MKTEDESAHRAEIGKTLSRWSLLLAVLVVFALWATWRMNRAASRLPSPEAGAPSMAEPIIEYWTCTMHPEIRESGPGDCPKCGMTLVPKYEGSDAPGVPPAAAGPAEPAAHPRADHAFGIVHCIAHGM